MNRPRRTITVEGQQLTIGPTESRPLCVWNTDGGLLVWWHHPEVAPEYSMWNPPGRCVEPQWKRTVESAALAEYLAHMRPETPLPPRHGRRPAQAGPGGT